ncbi:MAG: hypothetical protein ACI4MJ_09460 [Aristaeellaceae bacterium]
MSWHPFAPRRQDDAGRELPGWRKQSFALPYRGGMIWFEHLDGLGPHTALAREKLAQDAPRMLSPTGPGQVCVMLDRTRLDHALLAQLADMLLRGGKRFTRVVVVGAGLRARRWLRRAMGSAFPLAFFRDVELAKAWLIPGEHAR